MLGRQLHVQYTMQSVLPDQEFIRMFTAQVHLIVTVVVTVVLTSSQCHLSITDNNIILVPLIKQTFSTTSTCTCTCTVYNADPAVMETLSCELLTAPIAHSYCTCGVSNQQVASCDLCTG